MDKKGKALFEQARSRPKYLDASLNNLLNSPRTDGVVDYLFSFRLAWVKTNPFSLI